ncbi:MAG: LicD family protein [Bacteroidales bacterium]|nr:LicD family protein [Bacteroidales bacterium]
MLKLLSPKEIQTIQLEILSTINGYCREIGLKDSLCGGTLLGAVRHKGYIPWDNDVLMMPREDFDRFVARFKADGMTVMNLAEADDCAETFTIICKNGTVLIDRNFGQELWGVNVDLFPIDGALDDNIEDHYRKLDAVRKNFSPYARTTKL